MPQFKSKIEKQYSDIINQVNAIPSKCRDFGNGRGKSRIRPDRKAEEAQMVGLLGLQNGIQKLADDLHYCAKIARNDHAQNPDLASTKRNGEVAKSQNLMPLSHLIAQGEGHTIEFKETLEYDVKTNNSSKDVLLSSLKTIAGFLNATGGTLIIGVTDSGKITGIERDLSTMRHSNNDRFEQKIRSCLKDRLSPQPIGKVNISFEKFNEGTICRVDVMVNKEIIHLDGDIYVREGNTTIKLEGRARTDWIQQREK
jgi:hypothetical protein